MASSSDSFSSGGIGFIGILTIVFVIFKLLGKIAWSWWWVFSPIWIGLSLIVGILFITFTIMFIVEEKSRRRRFR